MRSVQNEKSWFKSIKIAQNMFGRYLIKHIDAVCKSADIKDYKYEKNYIYDRHKDVCIFEGVG